MHVVCPSCGQSLEYSRQAPRFCSNCGRALAGNTPQPTTAADPAGTVFHPGPTPPGQAPLPECVGGYRLLRPLGAGGMGTVYEGEEQATGRHVALKVIRPEFADSADAVERFRREGRLAGLIAHPRCVFVFAADEEAGRPYIVMELMPGRTLADVVAERGPLPPAEAVARILDVIEGLQEAHRCGLVHRDVKPSNCFLDGDGRVKVGDFGLSRSLVGDVKLTQSGAFLGTLLFAAPEQIRNDPVDHQADVYAVAATLYYLLTGRGPFESGDPAATLARTLTDPLTPMRRLRPELPRTLDEVVLKGLARERGRRWADLEEFRLALLPFVPGPQTLGGPGVRSAAFLLDWLLLAVVTLPLMPVLGPWVRHHGAGGWFALTGVFVVGFALLEWRWGGSPGKWLLRLRVRGARDDDRPSLDHAFLRVLAFTVFLSLGGATFWLHRLLLSSFPTAARDRVFAVLLGLLAELLTASGLLVMASTMRRRNGYRGLHEWLSDTKTIRLPTRRVPRPLPLVPPATHPGPPPPDLPGRLGAFTVREVVCSAVDEQVLLAEDAVLGRHVWIWLRPGDALSAARRNVSRTTRPRWLAGGTHGGRRWDAFVATPGRLLVDVAAGGRLFWPEVLPLLSQLAEELAAADADGTLPAALTVDQLWVEPNGRLQLLDVLLRPAGEGGSAEGGTRRALRLLHETAVLALEGRPRPPGAPPAPPRAPVPTYAAALLGRLSEVDRPFAEVAEARDALQEARELPAEVSRPRRGVHLTLQSALLAAGVAWMLAISSFPSWIAYFLNSFDAFACEQTREALHDCEAMDAAAVVAGADPWQRCAAALRLDADRRAVDHVRRREEQIPQGRAVFLQSSSWFARHFLEDLWAVRARADWSRQRHDVTIHPGSAQGDLRDGGLNTTASLNDGSWTELYTWWLVALPACPLVWALWAALTRGGLSRRVLGISLVQADGRPASRLRCAGRALLVWGPFTLLLLASTALDLGRIRAWFAGASAASLAWLAWSAWLTWWLAAALVPLYLWLGYWYPRRGPHDWLAGTYAVPR